MSVSMTLLLYKNHREGLHMNTQEETQINQTRRRTILLTPLLEEHHRIPMLVISYLIIPLWGTQHLMYSSIPRYATRFY